MNRCRLTLSFIGMMAIAAFFAPSSAIAQDVRLQGAGSTFVAPIMSRWVSEYQKLHPTAQIDYQSIGSGGGIKGITEKTVAFAATDAPMSRKELAAAGAPILQVPIIAGGVVAAYNLPDFKGDLKLDGPVLADIYLGKIVKWNDPRITALNPGAALPDLSITTAHRTDGSGTTYIFTNYLSTQSDDFRDKVGGAKQVEWIGGRGGKGNEGVTQVIQSTPGSVGYIELAYAEQNKIPFALIKNKDGQFIKATPDGISAAGEGAALEMKLNLVASLWNQPGAKSYPISGFTYVLVYTDLGYLKDESKARVLADFLLWASHEGQNFAAQLDYAPLSAAVQKKVGDAIGALTGAGGRVIRDAGK